MTYRGSIVDDQGKMNNFAVEPKMYVQENPRMGFTEYAELLNGRLAMIGFTSLLIVEILTKHNFIETLSKLQ
ncbi:MAG: chlorophyll a/b-binding protein [Xenococcaceae cyanobacterium]